MGNNRFFLSMLVAHLLNPLPSRRKCAFMQSKKKLDAKGLNLLDFIAMIHSHYFIFDQWHFGHHLIKILNITVSTRILSLFSLGLFLAFYFSILFCVKYNDFFWSLMMSLKLKKHLVVVYNPELYCD